MLALTGAVPPVSSSAARRRWRLDLAAKEKIAAAAVIVVCALFVAGPFAAIIAVGLHADLRRAYSRPSGLCRR